MPQDDRGQRREIRLLLVTIGVSVAMLLLLARFRFPDEPGRGAAEPAAAPLERLAARATFDELASTMADLERRVANRVEVVRIQPDRAAGSFAPAPRLTPDRGVIVLGPGEQLAGAGTDGPLVIGRDAVRGLAVIALSARPDNLVTSRAGPPRAGPRYVAVVEATSHGPTVRPVYVGRLDLIQDPRVSAPLLSVAAQQQTLPAGAAIFALDGQFIGLASTSGGTVTIVPGESLRGLALQAHDAPARPGDLGIEVQALTRPLARASGAESGVMVSYVDPRGPAAGLLNSGDVIRSIDGVNVTTAGGFQQLASSRQPGKAVAIAGIRQGKPIEVTLRAIEAGLSERSVASDADPGLVLRAVAGVGLEVVAVEPASAAARADLRPGDIIVAADGRAAPDADTLTAAFRKAPGGAALLLTVRRGTDHRVVALEKP